MEAPPQAPRAAMSIFAGCVTATIRASTASGSPTASRSSTSAACAMGTTCRARTVTGFTMETPRATCAERAEATIRASTASGSPTVPRLSISAVCATDTTIRARIAMESSTETTQSTNAGCAEATTRASTVLARPTAGWSLICAASVAAMDPRALIASMCPMESPRSTNAACAEETTRAAACSMTMACTTPRNAEEMGTVANPSRDASAISDGWAHSARSTRTSKSSRPVCAETQTVAPKVIAIQTPGTVYVIQDGPAPTALSLTVTGTESSTP